MPTNHIGLFRGIVAAALLALPVVPIAAQSSRPTSAEIAAAEARLPRAQEARMVGTAVIDNLEPVQWLPTGERFVHWPVTGQNAGTWVIVDAPTGREQPVISPAEVRAQLTRLLDAGVQIPRQIIFVLRPDGQGLLFRLGTRSFTLDFTDGQIAAADESDLAVMALMPGNAQLAPGGERLAGGRPGGGFGILGRQGTIVERGGEQMYGWGVPPGAWSPDGRFLWVSRVDARQVHRIPIVDYTTPIEQTMMVPYPKTGTTIPAYEHSLVDAATGTVTGLPALGDEGYHWMAGWRPDGSEAFLLVLSRDGKRLDLHAVNPATGAARLVLREENRATFVGDLNLLAGGWQRQFTPLPDNRGFVWASERDGWRNLYHYGYDGILQRQLTSGKLVVHEVSRVTARDVFFIASEDGDSPYDRHVYQASFAGGAPNRLTRESGIHVATFSPSGAYYVDAHSARDRPRVSVVASVDGRSSHRFTEADVSALLRTGYTPPEGFSALADDGVTPIHGVIFKPYDFDPSRRYPVINFVYAGPFMAVVPYGHAVCGCPVGSMATRANSLAQGGYIVVMVDGRGTPGRNKAFHDVNYGRIGQSEIRDQVAAVHQAAASRPYMDLERAGIFGYSWGGYYALRGMLTAPDFYKAGYSGAPGAVWELAQINEPNMGLLPGDMEAFEAAANEPLAGNLNGALKLWHGTSDANASLSTTLRMAGALTRANKHFEMQIVPGVTHALTSIDTYFTNDVLLFFARHLGGPR